MHCSSKRNSNFLRWKFFLKKETSKGKVQGNSGKVQNSGKLAFVVETMLNILCKHRFCDFIKIPKKFFSLPLLKKTTKSSHFFPAKKNIPVLWMELQTNKIRKFSKPHILTPSGKKNWKLQRFFRKMWIKKQHKLSKNKLFSSSQ